jgi:hypothetical protein
MVNIRKQNLLYVLRWQIDKLTNCHSAKRNKKGQCLSGNDFAIFVSLIYLVIGSIFLVIERYLRLRIKVVQYLMFNIPFIYFIFSNINDYNNPGYYLMNPIAYKWNTIYIPIGLIFCFSISIVLIFSLFGFAFWKWKKMTSI